MSHEKYIAVQEQHETTHLSSEQLKAHHEKLEKSRHEQAEKAKITSEKEAVAIEKLVKSEALSSDELQQTSNEQPATEKRTTSEDKAHSFATIMHHVQQSLSSPERNFSKFIHQPAVEKTSEALGKTVARPSGVIGATAAAIVGLLMIYSVARFAGFQLSGSEMPLLLAAGFVLGLLVEWAFKIVRTLLVPRSS